MEIDILSDKVKQQLSSWFHRRDRSLYLPPDTFYYLNNGSYLATAFISETILSANATSVTFSNIPQGFRHLMFFSSARGDGAVEADSVVIRFNGDAGSNYDAERLNGLGVTPTSVAARATATPFIGMSEGANSRGNNFGSTWAIIWNYQNGTIEKHALGISCIYGNSDADSDLIVSLRSTRWRNTNVITSLTLLNATSANFVTRSRFQLYGIL